MHLFLVSPYPVLGQLVNKSPGTSRVDYRAVIKFILNSPFMDVKYAILDIPFPTNKNKLHCIAFQSKQSDRVFDKPRIFLHLHSGYVYVALLVRCINSEGARGNYTLYSDVEVVPPNVLSLSVTLSSLFLKRPSCHVKVTFGYPTDRTDEFT